MALWRFVEHSTFPPGAQRQTLAFKQRETPPANPSVKE
jgi:hypothetical protein